MNYSSVIENFKSKKIVVIGDILLDHYIVGNCTRISPEAPVPVINYHNEFYSAGGAANVAANISKLGSRVWLSGRVGSDQEGEKLIELVKELNIPKKYILSATDYNTPTKTRILSDGQQVIRLDRETWQVSNKKHEKRSRDNFIYLIKHFKPDAVIISDYAKGYLTEDLIGYVIRISKQNNIAVVVDPKGPDFSKYRGADVITPNLKEAEQVCGFTIDSKKSLKEALRSINKATGIKNVFITRGKDGTSFLARGTNVTTVPASAREVFDVTGAGDTFVSVLSLSFISGCSTEDAVHIANEAAGLVIQRTGTSTVSPEGLVATLNKRNTQKLIPRDSVKQVINTVRSQGKRIVFTNGCFDLFHSGHLDLIERSKKHGDILIVALNSDRSTRRLKGKGRPIINQDNRVSILSAITFVDYVVIFDELTPYELIRDIKPSVITKGGDYKIEDVVGRDVVEKNGGEVIIIPVSNNISTSGLVERIKKAAKGSKKPA